MISDLIDENNSNRIDIESDWHSDLNRMLTNCKHRCWIYSENLPEHLFAFAEFTDNLSRIARANSRNQVNILIKNEDAIIRQANRLKLLHSHLPDKIHIKTVHQATPSFSTLILTDEHACLVQENEHLMHAYLSWHNPAIIRHAETVYKDHWERAETLNDLQYI